MRADLREVVEQLVELTGAAAPEVLGPEAAAPDAQALARQAEEGFYLIGIIGGKEVGKSALVNALVGQPITRPTSWGEGTQQVVAYAHAAHEPALQALLEREVGGRFQLVTHAIDALRRCVLLDLPDMDSHWRQHIEITRRMLRHMLYPVWMQSVEKYADVRAQELLKEVSAGNAPENFVFVLNKVDQVGDAGAVAELAEDYARRLGAVLKLARAPRVYAISAVAADSHDLPELRRTLLRERSEQVVNQSIALAERRAADSVLEWVRDRQLPVLIERTDRLWSRRRSWCNRG
jgi:GTPase Era involved in 16S rRNA processing